MNSVSMYIPVTAANSTGARLREVPFGPIHPKRLSIDATHGMTNFRKTAKFRFAGGQECPPHTSRSTPVGSIAERMEG
jgi:hypothetical protein